LRRTARFFTLSLPLQCPIEPRNTHAWRTSAKQFRNVSPESGRRDRISVGAASARCSSFFPPRNARNHPLTTPRIPSNLRSLFSQGKPPHTTEYAQPPCR
jgi:hypothetical protein